MSIPSETNQVLYSGTGSTTVFPYTFKISDQSHLRVVVANSSGVETVLTLTTYYTVSGVGDVGGGNVTLLNLTAITGSSILPTGWTLSIRSLIPLTQGTDLETVIGYDGDTIENMVDKLTQICQQQQNELDRSPRLPETVDTSVFSSTLPVPVANKVLGINAGATGFEYKAGLTSDYTIPDLTGNAGKPLMPNAGETSLEFGENTFAYTDITVKTDNYTVTTSDYGKLLVMNNASAKAFTLPAIVGDEVLFLSNVGAGVCTLTPGGGNTTQKASLIEGESVVLVGDLANTTWRALAGRFELATNPGLEYTSGTLRIKAYNGIALSASGVAVDLATNPGLEFSSGKLRIKAYDGIALSADGAAVDLATDPGLEFSGGQLQAKVGNTLQRTASGLDIAWEYDSGWTALNLNTLKTVAHGISLSFPTDILEISVYWRASSGGSYIVPIGNFYDTSDGDGIRTTYDGTNIYIKAGTVGFTRYVDSGGTQQTAGNGDIRILARKAVL